MAECDAAGNVNVSRFGGRLAGAGGFINISQNARKVVFAGTFTGGGLEIAVEDGELRIVEEGQQREVRRARSSRSPSAAATPPSAGSRSLRHRALRVPPDAGGLELIEVAPGIDIERDILAAHGLRARDRRSRRRWTPASSAPSRWS